MKEDELKELFLAEAQEQQEQLNRLFTALEKQPQDQKLIEQIFRITHTLKANAAGLGFQDLAAMAHLVEDIFSAAKAEKVVIDEALFNDLFRANDMQMALIQHIRDSSSEKPRFRGIKTKLEVFLRNLYKKEEPVPEITSPETVIIPGMAPVPHQEKTKEESPKEQAAKELVVQEERTVDQMPVAESITFSDSIYIPIKKLDDLMNLVGELLIEKDRIINLGLRQQIAQRNEYTRLQRISSDLQYAVMDVRLVQVGVLFNKFHRIVRDVASTEGKQVNLVLEGTDNEIDRNILQIISDSLVHLVRNAISHGIEPEDERIKAGKPARGTLTLSAQNIKEEVLIRIQDDGRGLQIENIRKKAVEKGFMSADEAAKADEESLIQLIFEAGFSSKSEVTDISGRGVGMDVVRKAVDAVGGKIDIQTVPLKGTVITLTLPSSMAVKGALLFGLGQHTYAVPLSYTSAVTSFYKKDLHRVSQGLVADYLGKTIGIVFLQDLFALPNLQALQQEGVLQQRYEGLPPEQKLDVVLISYNHREIGLVVDKLYQQKEIVEKPLGYFFKNTPFISGATILGDGQVCLVLDAPFLMNTLFKTQKAAHTG